MKPLLFMLLVLVVVSVCMTVVCMGYDVVNVNVPYQEPDARPGSGSDPPLRSR